MKLSDNFWVNEFQRSETAVRLDIQEQFEPLPEYVLSNLNDLCDEVLQPLRNAFQARMFINSGYRCPALNKAVGGSKNSDHMKGGAADIVCKDPEMLYKMAIELGLPFKQLILYKSRNFVHISYDENDKRKQSWEQA